MDCKEILTKLIKKIVIPNQFPGLLHYVDQCGRVSATQVKNLSDGITYIKVLTQFNTTFSLVFPIQITFSPTNFHRLYSTKHKIEPFNDSSKTLNLMRTKQQSRFKTSNTETSIIMSNVCQINLSDKTMKYKHWCFQISKIVSQKIILAF